MWFAERGAVGTLAAAGVEGPSVALPHLDTIQASFGRHDVSHVQAHVGGAAAEANAAISAEAYATGHHVAFAGPPSLHTAAHEAAHVVQQAAGVRLLGGVGAEGDAYERHADEVADAVVAGRSAEALLDRHAGGGGGGSRVVQRRLVVGGKEIDAGAVDGALKAAQGGGLIDKAELGELKRLQDEATDKADHTYADWKSAVQGIVLHDAKSLGTLSLHSGSITFTNVSKSHAAQAQQLIDLIARHPLITAYINNRPCFITLVNSPGNPASVIDKKTQVNIELASWYFETYELGYTLGMLMHEFAIHPMADADPNVALTEQFLKGQDIDTGVKDGKEKHMINTDRAGQDDHVFGALLGTPRNKIYLDAVIEMAVVLADEAGKKGSGIGMEQVTNLLDCFIMDCASILATNDHRAKGVTSPGLVAAIFNDYLGNLPALIKDKRVAAALPGQKGRWTVLTSYSTVLGRLMVGQASGKSRDQATYQPSAQQATYLEQQGLRLHWIDPDGRCVFGALGHVMGISTQQAILNTLALLDANNGALSLMITNAGQTVAAVAKAIREGRWADPDVGDLILEVAATALGASVTVLLPNGATHAVNGGGAVIIKVTNPLEHYHATV